MGELIMNNEVALSLLEQLLKLFLDRFGVAAYH